MKTEFSLANPKDYEISGVEAIRTPRPVFFYEKLLANRKRVLEETGGADGLRLMAKTVKAPALLRMYVEKGVQRFKASSVNEARDALIPAGASDILISYPLLGPHIDDYLDLAGQYPEVRVSTLVTNRTVALALSEAAEARNQSIHVFLDINPHMHRTGVLFGTPLLEFVETLRDCRFLRLVGLHAYDGHIRHENPRVLDRYTVDLLRLLDETVQTLSELDVAIEEVVTSSSLTFAATAAAYRSHQGEFEWRHTVSPGTCVLWDTNYNGIQPGHFAYAAAVATRVIDVINREGPDIVTTDAGVKMGVSPDAGPVHVTSIDGYAPFGGSERHGTLVEHQFDRATWLPLPPVARIQVGDVVLLFPPHICTTLNQYNYGYMVRDGRVAEKVEIAARDG